MRFDPETYKSWPLERLERERLRVIDRTCDDVTIKVGSQRWNEGVELVRMLDDMIKGRKKARKTLH